MLHVRVSALPRVLFVEVVLAAVGSGRPRRVEEARGTAEGGTGGKLVIRHFLSHLPLKTRVLMLGYGCAEFAKPAREKGHSVTFVTDAEERGPIFGDDDSVVIHCRIGVDPCMVKMIDGYWVRPITLPEIINQLPGPYGAVICNLDDRNRLVAQSDTLKAMYPQAFAYPDDGHNEGIIAEYGRRGYQHGVMDGWLVFWRSL